MDGSSHNQPRLFWSLGSSHDPSLLPSDAPSHRLATSPEPPQKRRRVDSESRESQSPAPTPLFSPSISSIRTARTSPSPSLSLPPSQAPSTPKHAVRTSIRLPAWNGVARRLIAVKADPKPKRTVTAAMLGQPVPPPPLFRPSPSKAKKPPLPASTTQDKPSQPTKAIPHPTTSGTWRVADIPVTCLNSDPDYKKHRNEWAREQINKIRARGYASQLRVNSARFLSEGFTMYWETSAAVYPTTLLQPIRLPSPPPPIKRVWDRPRGSFGGWQSSKDPGRGHPPMVTPSTTLTSASKNLHIMKEDTRPRTRSRMSYLAQRQPSAALSVQSLPNERTNRPPVEPRSSSIDHARPVRQPSPTISGPSSSRYMTPHAGLQPVDVALEHDVSANADFESVDEERRVEGLISFDSGPEGPQQRPQDNRTAAEEPVSSDDDMYMSWSGGCEQCGTAVNHQQHSSPRPESEDPVSPPEEASPVDSQAGSGIFNRHSLPTGISFELEKRGEDFLRDYMTVFDAGKPLDGAYHHLATFSERAILQASTGISECQPQVGTTEQTPAIAVDRLRKSLGLRFGYQAARYDLVVMYDIFAYGSSSRELQNAAEDGHSGIGMMLVCYIERFGERLGTASGRLACEMSFVLATKEQSQHSSSKKTFGSLVALAHQITLRLVPDDANPPKEEPIVYKLQWTDSNPMLPT